ncbi:MAG: tryptophan synthase subunit alpha, partial [Nitrospinae bacterium RIFCSPLOWO2_12_FULL_47_7]
MSRIQERFKLLRSKNEKALSAFITAGDPDLAATKELFSILEKNGADIIELGVPFSDPIADGPVIQKSALRALKSGATLKKIIHLVAEIRKSSQLPIVLMTSFNPVYVYGQEKFVDDAVRAGVDGLIVTDLPPEEAVSLENHAHQNGLDMIHLLAPTSTEDRIRTVGQRTRGFIYYISLTGITGTRDSLSDGLQQKVEAIKQTTSLPVLIGFGISGPEQAGKAASISDGVIVGSAIVRMI